MQTFQSSVQLHTGFPPQTNLLWQCLHDLCIPTVKPDRSRAEATAGHQPQQLVTPEGVRSALQWEWSRNESHFLRHTTSNIVCNLLFCLSYSGKVSREKTFANWWKIWFVQRKLSWIVRFCRTKGRHAPKFHGENFLKYPQNLAKFVKAFSLKSQVLAIRYLLVKWY